MAGNEIRIRSWLKDEVSGSVGKIKDKFDHLGKSQGFKSVVQGVGMGVGVAAWGMLTSAAGRATDVIGDATRAALEEERSVAKLDAALRANVASYNGNTDAIEDTLAARMRLGYADDEQRDSLARLVSVTKDSTKALELQRTAMDLARLRGMDLATASDLIGKVYGGNIGILSRYGIQLKKGTTSTEALAEIQKRAAGQAEAYAETNEGKLLASQIKVNEAMEKLGATTMPIVVGATETAAGAIEDLAANLDLIAVNFGGAEEAGFDLGEALESLPFVGLGLKAYNMANDVRKATEESAERADYMKDRVKDDLRDAGGALKKFGNKAGETAEKIGDATGDVEDSFGAMVDSMITDTQKLIDDVFDPIEIRADIYQQRMEQNAAEERLRDAETAREKREATDDIMASIGDQADSLIKLSERGKLTAKDIDRFEKDVLQSYEALGKEVPADIRKIIRELRNLDKWDGHTVNVYTSVTTSGGKKKPKAMGGPVTANEVYMVGEQGPEMFVPNQSGTIVPNHKLGAGGMGSNYNFYLTVQGDLKARDGFEVLETMRRLQAVAQPIRGAM